VALRDSRSASVLKASFVAARHGFALLTQALPHRPAKTRAPRLSHRYDPAGSAKRDDDEIRRVPQPPAVAAPAPPHRLLQREQPAPDLLPLLHHVLDTGRVAPVHRARHRPRLRHEARQHLQQRPKPADGTFFCPPDGAVIRATGEAATSPAVRRDHMHRENDAHTTSAGEAVLEEQQALMPRGTRLSWTPHRVGRPRYRKKEPTPMHANVRKKRKWAGGLARPLGGSLPSATWRGARVRCPQSDLRFCRHWSCTCGFSSSLPEDHATPLERRGILPSWSLPVGKTPRKLATRSPSLPATV
jgi:hypothetical protein